MMVFIVHRIQKGMVFYYLVEQYLRITKHESTKVYGRSFNR